MGYWGAFDFNFARAPFHSVDLDFWTVIDAVQHSQFLVTGAGLLYHLFIHAAANGEGGGSHSVLQALYLDGVMFDPSLSFSGFSAYHYDKTSKPVSLQEYNVDGDNFLLYYFPNGLNS
ncbi:unnamed protein product, partial [marine sediment metagenome]